MDWEQCSTLRSRRWQVTVTTIFIAIALSLGASRSISVLYKYILRPILENWITTPLGYTVELGSFLGLHPWGFAIGPVRMSSGFEGNSKLLLDRLEVSLLPLESLRRWRPVASMNMDGAHIDLEHNLYDLSQALSLSKRDSLPKLDLHLNLDNPARINLWSTGLKLTAAGRLVVRLADNWTGGEIQLSLPGNGRVWLSGHGRWDRPNFNLDSRIERIQLQIFEQLSSPITAQLQIRGQLGGKLQLQNQDGRLGCHGKISLAGLQLRVRALKEVLQAPETQLVCRNDRLLISKSTLVYGPWEMLLAGGLRLNHSYGLDLSLKESRQGHTFHSRLDGPWHQPRFRLNGHWALRQSLSIDIDRPTLHLWLDGDWRSAPQPAIRLEKLVLQSPGVNVSASGNVYPRLDISTNQLLIAKLAWKELPVVSKLLGKSAPIRGKLTVSGPTYNPAIGLTASQADSALLENWLLRASWSAAEGIAQLKHFHAPNLLFSAELPLITDGEFKLGNLSATLDINSFPLKRFRSLLGIPIDGTLNLAGSMHGPLHALKPDFNLEVTNPRVGNLRLLEHWTGRLDSSPNAARMLQMSHGIESEELLTAHLGYNWLPQQVRLERQDGTLSIVGSPALYRWHAKRLPLKGMEIMLPAKQQFEGIDGQLSGSGDLYLQPLLTQGSIKLHNFSAVGVKFQQVFLRAKYSDYRFRFSGELLPHSTGQVTVSGHGQLDGSLTTMLKANRLDTRWLTSAALQLSNSKNTFFGTDNPATNFRSSLLNNLKRFLESLPKNARETHNILPSSWEKDIYSKLVHPRNLRGQIDAVINIQGKHLKDLDIDLHARGHFWTEEESKDRALQIRPFLIMVRGALWKGKGELSLLQLPISLMALIAPAPITVQGSLNMRGQYRFEAGSPRLDVKLGLEKASIGSFGIKIERGQVSLIDDTATLNLVIRGSGSRQVVNLTGRIPLTLERQETFDVRLEACGDALRFLMGLTEDVANWKFGSVDLKILLSGSVSNLRVNGFLVLQGGSLEIGRQHISDAKASVIFSLDQIHLGEFSARIGSQGKLTAYGTLPMLQRSASGQDPLIIHAKQLQLSLPSATVNAAGVLQIMGAVVRPEIGGWLTINNGLLTPARSLFMRWKPGISLTNGSSIIPRNKKTDITAVGAGTLLEENWDFQKTLILLGADIRASGSYIPEIRIPDISTIYFNSLSLQVGPRLRVLVTPIADFRANGLLTLDGPLDANLKLRGVVKLLSGRISLFTTVFRLDQHTPNVAIFTPSLGLIPYVDLAMDTRISESLDDLDKDIISKQVFDINGNDSTDLGQQLRLVEVEVTSSGPANLLAKNITLRSSPPIPRLQLLNLIGGSSFASLSSAGTGTALATVLGQSLLSPVLGIIGETFRQRLQFSIYPTYIVPKIQTQQEQISGKLPPKLAVVADAGFAITDGFEFSAMTTLNRDDIAPQAMLSYRLSENVGISGSINSQGNWQTQLQLFLRF